MSDERRPVKLAKWPFYLADLVLSGIIVFVLYQLGTFEGTVEMVIVATCLAVAAVAAWISILPWIREHDATVQLNESSNLKSALEQVKSIEKVADLIRQSNLQWQSIQDASARTIATAGEITDRMKAEADEFMRFLSQAHDQERAGLRLEVEKMRRMEGDWIKVAVQMLDHTFAIYRAAERSGQRNLIAQMSQFQNACRAVTRRMGLAPFVPVAGEAFDPRAHQLPDAKQAVAEGAKVGEILAAGFTYQGQLLRRALVLLESANRGPDERTGIPEEISQGSHNFPQEAGADENAVDEPLDQSREEAPPFEPGAGGPFEEAAAREELQKPEIAAGVDAFEAVEQPQAAPEKFESDSRKESAPVRSEESDVPGQSQALGSRPKGSPQEELPF